MSELTSLFKKLSEFYDPNSQWEQIEKIYEQQAAAKDTVGKDGINSEYIAAVPFIQGALGNPQVLATMLELCTTLRNISSDSRDDSYNHESWEQILKVATRDGYLAFVYALAGLASLDSTSVVFAKLSLTAVNTYLLSLTIRGAKGFHIFDEAVIAHCLQVFAIVERIQNSDVLSHMSRQQPVEIWVRFATFCDDLKQLLRYVHFSEHKTTRDALLRKLIEMQYLNYERGYANNYAANLHTKCFEIFEEVINAHNGEPEETLLRIMNMSVFLHTHPQRPKNSNNNSADQTRPEHISDWFIQCIPKYPRLLVKVLAFYIECVVTNPIKTWKTEQTQRALEYAAKYDAALFTKCNESSMEFLSDAIRSDEVMIRSRAVDLMARILQVESQVDWQMFRHEVSPTPREVYIIQELIEALQDSNNGIKLKSVHALHNALTKGSPNAQKILSECLRFVQFSGVDVVLPDEPRIGKNEIRYEKPDALTPNYTFEGHELLALSFMRLPEYVFTHLYQNPLSHIRRAGVMFVEQIALLNPRIIFSTEFVTETTRLVAEQTTLVRKQTLSSVDALLARYPNCYHMIWVWCKILAPMLHDSDAKNIELAMDCFRKRVLLNIKGIDQSNKAEHFMPWVIIRTMLTTQSRLYLQTCFHLSLQQRMVTTQMLSVIESHLLTTNSTEAWVLLSFVSGKVKSTEPDALIHHFISMQSWNKETNMSIALEVLENCIGSFSHSALNHAFNHLLSHIREGKLLPALTGKAFDFLLVIDNRSTISGSRTSSPYSDFDKERWIVELHDFLEYRILAGIEDFPDNRYTLMSHLFTYSEANLHARLRPPHTTIIAFVHKYMTECMRLSDDELNLDNEQLFSLMTLLSGRFSLRDATLANTTCTLYGAILGHIDRPPIVNTIIVSLMDLCKKHTQIVERIIDRVLQKLSSPFAVNRIETFKCFEKLVLQDQLKLRGSLLIALLATILDDSEDLALRATNFFVEFLGKKNATLFQKCLIECPFVFNEYKNFAGLDSFAESVIKSPLKGEAKRKSRQLLYNHFIAEMDDINLILYFGQLKLVAEKSKGDPLLKSTEGVALIKDILFILRRVCQVTKEQNTNTEGKDKGESCEDADEVADIIAAADDKATSSSANQVQTGGGRGRKRRELTMSEAMSQLEKSLIFIPTIHEHMIAFDSSLEQSFDDLGRELAKRFPNLIDYAQPAAFWSKYHTKNMAKGTTKKRKSSHRVDEQAETSGVNPECTDDSPNGNASDDDLPLVYSAKRNAGHLRSLTPAIMHRGALPIKYLFQPNI